MARTPSRFSRRDPARFQDKIAPGRAVQRRITRSGGYGVSDVQFSINMEDLRDFQQELHIMGRRAQGIVNRRAVRAGMKPIRERMRQLAPVHKRYSKRTGRQLKKTRSSRLRKSIVNNGPWTYRNSGVTVGLVGPRWGKDKTGNNPGRYAHLVELGHNILEQPYRSKKGAPVWRKIKARPFVNPALKSQIGRSIQEMKRVYRSELFKRTGLARYRPAA